MNPQALEDFLPHLNIQVDGVPRIFMLDALRLTCIEFCEQTLLFRETVELPISADVSDYELEPSLCDSEVCRILDVWINSARIRAITPDDGIRTNEIYDSATPTSYYTMDPALLTLVPTPSATADLKVSFAYKPEHDADNVPETLYTTYREIIVRGAAARLLIMPNRPWTNVEHGGLYRKLYWQALHTMARQDHWDGFTRQKQVVRGTFL